MKHHTTASIGELCHVSIGRTPRRSESRYWNGPHPWATIRDLDGQTLKFTKQGITDAALKEVMPKPAEPGTLLFSFKLTIGKVAFAGCKLHHNEAIAALPIRDPTVLDRDFLFHALQIKTHDSNANHAVLGKVLNKRKIEELEIPLPPIDEQQRIASILNRAARIGHLRSQANRYLREFTSTLFVKMFGDPTENSMGWEIVRLGDVAGRGQYGLNTSATLDGRGVRFIRITDIDKNGNLIADRRVAVDSQTPNLERYELVPNDILIARSGTVGKSYRHDNIGEPSVFAGYLIRFRADERKILPVYLANFLRSLEYWRQIRNLKRVVAQPNVNAKELASILIPLPPLSEQQRFASIVNRVSRTSVAHQIASETASALSASLADRLLGSST